MKAKEATTHIDFDKLIKFIESEIDTMEYEHRLHDYEYKNRPYYEQILACVKYVKEHSMM